MPIELSQSKIEDGWMHAPYKSALSIKTPEPTKHYYFRAPELPLGLTIDRNGNISGTPKSSNTPAPSKYFIFVYEVANDTTDPSAEAIPVLTTELSMVVHPPLRIVPGPDAALPTNWLRMGQNIENVQFTVDSPEASNLWDWTCTDPLTGLTIENGLLKGTLDQKYAPKGADGDARSVEIKAVLKSNKNKSAISPTHDFVIYPKLTIKVTHPHRPIPKTAFSAEATAPTAGATPNAKGLTYSFATIDPRLKDWLKISETDGKLSGTPPDKTTAGVPTANVTIQVKDKAGYIATSQPIDFAVNDPAPIELSATKGEGKEVAFAGEAIDCTLSLKDGSGLDGLTLSIVKTYPAEAKAGFRIAGNRIIGNFPSIPSNEEHPDFSIWVLATDADGGNNGKEGQEFKFQFGRRIRIQSLNSRDIPTVEKTTTGAAAVAYEDFARGVEGAPFTGIKIDPINPADGEVTRIGNTLVMFKPNQTTGEIKVNYTISNAHDSQKNTLSFKVVAARLRATPPKTVDISPGDKNIFVELSDDALSNESFVRDVLFAPPGRGVTIEKAPGTRKVGGNNVKTLGVNVTVSPDASLEKINVTYVLTSSDDQVSQASTLPINIVARKPA